MGGCCSAPLDAMEVAEQQAMQQAGSRDVRAAAGGAVPPATPEPAQPAVATGLGPRDLTFTNPKGEKLVGVLVEAGSDDVVILCHGYVANMSMCQFPRLAAALAGAGLSSFRFDHACAIFSRSERKGPFVLGNHDDEVADMAAACEFMSSLGKRVVCLLGHSKGGMNSVIFAARHPGLSPKVINLAGRFRPREGMLQRFGADVEERLAAGPIPMKESWGEWELTKEDLANRISKDMPGLAAAIPATTRMLCLHGELDTTIPYQESEECAAAVGPHARFQLVPGADHNFSGKESGDALAAAVLEFVLEKP